MKILHLNKGELDSESENGGNGLDGSDTDDDKKKIEKLLDFIKNNLRSVKMFVKF